MPIENEKILGWAADYVGVPTGKGMQESLFDGAIRYVGDFNNRPKCIDPREYQDLINHGIGIALVHENAADDFKGGVAGGIDDAEYARHWANELGHPLNRPIYFTVDTQLLTVTDFSVLDAYFTGINDRLPTSVVGAYGQYRVIEYLADHKLASFFWQTLAWSRKPDGSGEYQLSKHNNLLQILGTLIVDNVTMDRNEILKEDWGQRNYIGETPKPIEPIIKRVSNMLVLRADGIGPLVLTDGFKWRILTNEEHDVYVTQGKINEVNLTKDPKKYKDMITALKAL